MAVDASVPWEWTARRDVSHPYLTGNGFSCYCRYVLNHDGFRVNRRVKNDWYFAKTDHLNTFLSQYAPRSEFVLLTHNSDQSVGPMHEALLADPRLRMWFAQNAEFAHPKLKPIAIGIANAGYAHGDVRTLNKVRAMQLAKTNLFYVNFAVKNHPERVYCLEQIGLSMTPGMNGGWDGFAGGYRQPNTFEGYLNDMARSYFVISPRGHGIDCHRHWEALYMGAIPVVTRSAVVEAHRDMPFVVLKDWSEFRHLSFSPELYARIWRDTCQMDLRIDRYVEGLRRIVAGIQR